MKQKRNRLPHGIKLKDVAPYYIYFLAKGFDVPSIARITKEKTMTIYYRLNLIGVRFTSLNSAKMQVAAYSYRHGQKATYSLFPWLTTQKLSAYRQSLKRHYNSQHLHSAIKREPVTDIFLASKLDENVFKSILNEYTSKSIQNKPQPFLIDSKGNCIALNAHHKLLNNFQN